MLTPPSSSFSSPPPPSSPNPKRRRLDLPPSPPSSFDSLSDDLFLAIMSSVASSASSPSHIINTMLVCKRFCSAMSNPVVLAVVSPSAIAVKARSWSDGAEKFLQRCADAGNADAAYLLGMIRCYCLKEMPAGVSLIARAALKANHPDALYSLAIIQFNGSGGSSGKDRNPKSGAALCAKAAVRGHVGALRELGHCLQDGYGVERKVEEGSRLLVQASAREAAARLEGRYGAEAVQALRALKGKCVDEEMKEAGETEVDKKEKRAQLAMKVMKEAKERGILTPLVGMEEEEEEKKQEWKGVNAANRFLVEWYTERKAEGEEERRFLAMCANKGCGRVEMRRHEFRRCFACLAVNYCSRTCQALDWERRHKIQCLRRPPPAIAAAAAAGAAARAAQIN